MHEVFTKELDEIIPGMAGSGAPRPAMAQSGKSSSNERKSVQEEYYENLKLSAYGNEIINTIGAINLTILMAIFYFVIERFIF